MVSFLVVPVVLPAEEYEGEREHGMKLTSSLTSTSGLSSSSSSSSSCSWSERAGEMRCFLRGGCELIAGSIKVTRFLMSGTPFIVQLAPVKEGRWRAKRGGEGAQASVCLELEGEGEGRVEESPAGAVWSALLANIGERDEAQVERESEGERRKEARTSFHSEDFRGTTRRARRLMDLLSTNAKLQLLQNAQTSSQAQISLNASCFFGACPPPPPPPLKLPKSPNASCCPPLVAGAGAPHGLEAADEKGSED